MQGNDVYSLKQTSNQPVTSVNFANGEPGELIYGVGDVINICNSLGTKTVVFKYGNEDNNA